MNPNDLTLEFARSHLQAVETRFREAEEARRQAILEAVDAEVPLREIAEIVGRSHEWVRRLVASDGQVIVEAGELSVALSGRQVEMLIYKLSGIAKRQFPRDVELLEAGDKWLPTAGALARAFQAAMSDEEGQPIVLDQARSIALYQILRLTYFDGRSTLARLYTALGLQLGQTTPHVIARMRARKL